MRPVRLFTLWVFLASVSVLAKQSVKLEPLPTDLLSMSAENLPGLFQEQKLADLDHYWDGLLKDPKRFESVGDIMPLYEFNRKSAQVWERMFDCHQGDIEKMRLDYAKGKICSNAPDGNELWETLKTVREETRGWLASVHLASLRGGEFGSAGENNPIKKYSISLYGSLHDYSPYIKFNTLWMQIVYEIAANNLLYEGLDNSEYRKLISSPGGMLGRWQDKLQQRMGLFGPAKPDFLKSSGDFIKTEDPFGAPRDEEARKKLLSSNRTLFTVIKLIEYQSPLKCIERGLYPEVATVLVDGWSPSFGISQDPEFANFHDEAIGASVWNRLACQIPPFVKKSGARRNFFRLVRFFRSMDAFYSGANEK